MSEFKPKLKSDNSLLHQLARDGKGPELLLHINVTNIDEKNCNGHSVLMLSAYHGHMNLSRQLILKGADLDSIDHLGNTVLMGVAFKGNLAMVKLLVESGADYMQINIDGKKASDFAVLFGQEEVANYLKDIELREFRPITHFIKTWFGF